MGYSGFGMQRWITTLKPRKFLGKRSKPDGGGAESNYGPRISDYYHLKPNKLENLLKKKFSPAYRKQLESEIKEENNRRLLLNILSFIIAVVVVAAMLVFFMSKFDLF